MKKQILILGGTMFVGRALVEKLRLSPGYDITLFNRGKSNIGLFPDVKQLHGNRETDDFGQIYNQNWDCVIDFSGYYPLTFEKHLANLTGKATRYIFVSTISVYDIGKFDNRAITIQDEILGCTEEQKASRLPDAYGEKKAEMERILHRQDWLDKIILRPGFIYGRYDWTERFYYWLYRAKFSDKMLMPADFPVSLTYAGDLANAIANAIDIAEHLPVYNTISQNTVSLRTIVTTAAGILNRQVDFTEASEALLEKNDLDYSAFPLFVPLNFRVEGNQWLTDFNITATGFKESVASSIMYYESLGWPEPKAGMRVDKEKLILGI